MLLAVAGGTPNVHLMLCGHCKGGVPYERPEDFAASSKSTVATAVACQGQ